MYVHRKFESPVLGQFEVIKYKQPHETLGREREGESVCVCVCVCVCVRERGRECECV